jgi:hypothetical protein
MKSLIVEMMWLKNGASRSKYELAKFLAEEPEYDGNFFFTY